MNAAQWLQATDPVRLLEQVQQRKLASARQMRLFACACCRRIWPLLKDKRSRAAVAASERYADKQIARAELLAAQQAAMLGQQRFDEYVYPAQNAAASAARPTLVPRWIAQLTLWAAGSEAVRIGQGPPLADRARSDEMEQRHQCVLLRDIVGNPFRPVKLDPSWLTDTVVRLAQGIYEQRAFERLPILADTLEDAGCDSAAILNHCRQPGEHVRGCWCVDLVLGKS